MNEEEREGFIKRIGISADDSEETDEDEDDPEQHKYHCKKCQVNISPVSSVCAESCLA